MKKILLFSSVCKSKSILEITLNSYINLQKNNFKIDFLFYNDNKDIVAKEYLTNFCNAYSNCSLLPQLKIGENEYEDHNWNQSRINRIILIKNEAIKIALNNNYDFLFLVDADLVLNSNTLTHLFELDRGFVFEVFWTLFFNEPYYKPNAWDLHSWAYKGPETILKLKEKGNFIVGGGGACTLLSKEILLKGLSFDRLPSLYYQGEDRHFCTRAQALGYDIVVDTSYPAYHIFSELQCKEAKDWYLNGAEPIFFRQWLNSDWEKKVIQSFKRKDKNIFYKIKRFQYEIRKSFKRIFIND